MIYELFALLSSLIVNTISSLGYFGVAFLMALESASLPVPSEIIMPFAGFLVFTGKFSFWLVVFWGTIGNLIGSVVAYIVGYYGGRPLVEKYGKYVLISHHDLDMAQRWFEKYGKISIFFSRLLPVVRTFISLPAGVARMPFGQFCFYTFIGSLPWSLALTYSGMAAGDNWPILETYFKKFDWLIGVVIVLAVVFWIYKKIRTSLSSENLD
ncbi:MAG: DedA family protein [Patescibacteria group bacterium]